MPASQPAPPPQPSGPIEPLKLGRLSVEPFKKVAAKLRRAHYDAESLGVQELRFDLQYRGKLQQVQVLAQGTWRRGKKPQLKLLKVLRFGKELPPPADKDVGQKIAWERLREKLDRLVQGIGSGFLSQRIQSWTKLEGQVSKRGGKLHLSFEQEMGKTEVVVGRKYTVEKVSVVSPRGFTRSMSYKHRLEGGRNLVKEALLRGRTHKKMRQKAEMVIRSIDGTRFSIRHQQVGRFWLPVKLDKEVPKLKDKISMTIKYQSVKP